MPPEIFTWRHTAKLAAFLALSLCALSGPAQQAPASHQEIAQPSGSASAASQPQDAKRTELLRQLAEIEQRIQKEGGGRIRYIGPATEDEPFKSYYRRFADRIEAAGTSRFPKRNGMPVYGNVLVNVSIGSRGQLKDIDVFRSDDPFLSKFSISLLRSLKSYEAFPPEMARAVDSVVLSAKMKYQHVE